MNKIGKGFLLYFFILEGLKSMSVEIKQVIRGSVAQQAGLLPGDILLSINENEIEDILDYQFYASEKKLKLKIGRNNRERTFFIKKDEYEDLGLEFETFLMDKKQRCKNNCIFCFIDQLPKGLREGLYFKDDDERLSFLFGNYITLTNLKKRDVERIVKMKISPVNISVHTTDPLLRVKMMGNRFAGDALKIIDEFANSSIKMNCQLVLCPEINDGEHLERSLRDLSSFFPNIQSIAVVPVGITKYRENLYPLNPFTKKSAAEVIETIMNFSTEFMKKNGTHLAYPADEFFLKAEIPIPEYNYYEEFFQIENGVGMISQFSKEFYDALEESEYHEVQRIKTTVVTGTAAKETIFGLVDSARQRWHNLQCEVSDIKNSFFGENITVCGLLTGQDILNQLTSRNIGDRIIIPKSMLRHEGDLFLDGLSVRELENSLKVPITVCDIDGRMFLETLLGRNTDG